LFDSRFKTLQQNRKTIERTSDRAMVFMLLNDEEEWGKLERRTKNKYKKLIKEISLIDLTDLMKSTLKANEKQLQKQIDFWQREFRFWK
ncbi:TPA: replication initiation protein, partial [Enterococcus faecalis]|nr:replication initiation protein [Enterococcus faecalis]